MSRRDWLLLTIGDSIEPIQIQKTMFKFAKESGAPEGATYEFSAYNWGPCSFKIYDDLGDMREEGLIDAFPTGRGWNRYRLTPEGRSRADSFRAKQRKSNLTVLQALDTIRAWVTSRAFATLLNDVYSAYPEYTTASLFSR